MSEQMLSDAIEALPLPVAIIGPMHRLRLANAPALALFGTEALGQHFVVSIRQPTVVEAVENVLAGGDGEEVSLHMSDGGRDMRWRVLIRPVELDDGRGAIASFDDITMAEETTQMRRDFVANVSHELRTPLTAFMGFVETLKGAARDDPEARDRFLSIMEREATRMARLIDDLLSLSRVEQEERQRPREDVDLVSVAHQVRMLMVKGHGEDRITVTGPPDAVVPGDQRQLMQVISNLVENALKYGGAEGTVTVHISGPAYETTLRANGWRIAVSDEGEGIDEHHIPRLTERFYRVDTHRSREMGGTGLGLAIVKHIITRHRGRLKIESVPGKGSTFSVLLPA